MRIDGTILFLAVVSPTGNLADKLALMGRHPGLPFVWSEVTLWEGLNFALVTSLGSTELLVELTGDGATMSCCLTRSR
jgi:hypothetical protein